jgi:hypothetical protein
VGTGGFAKIGEAIAQSHAGDTVEVSSGEYPEQLRLKSGVTVKGRLANVPVLRADPLPAGAAVAVVADGVQGARLSGFRIRADAQAPLATAVAISDSDLDLQDTEIIGATTGVDIRGKSQPVLRANSIQDCRDAGIHISGISAPRLLYNAVLHNGRGVLVESPAQPVLQGNIFRDNTGEPLSLPEGFDRESILKFNFFVPATPPVRHRTGASH